MRRFEDPRDQLNQLNVELFYNFCFSRFLCREYAMVGDVVNLSARLMIAAADNSLLIDHSTYLACKGREIFLISFVTFLIFTL